VCVREIRCGRAEKNEVLHKQQRQSGADVIGMIYGEVVIVWADGMTVRSDG
jgi:hypothetical protein